MKEKTSLLEKKAYTAPDIKVVVVEIEQNILAGGSAPSMPGEDW